MYKFILVLFFIPVINYSQESPYFKLDEQVKDYYFENIHEVDSTINIKSKVLEWIALNFKDSNHVLKLDSSDKTIVKGLFKINYESLGYPIESNVEFDLIVSYKPGRYRLQIMSMRVQTPVTNSNDISTPVYSYVKSNNSFDDYKKIIQSYADNATNKQLKKYYEKTLADEEGMRKSYEDYKTVSFLVLNEIKEECISTDKSIHNYIIIKSDKKDDW